MDEFTVTIYCTGKSVEGTAERSHQAKERSLAHFAPNPPPSSESYLAHQYRWRVLHRQSTRAGRKTEKGTIEARVPIHIEKLLGDTPYDLRVHGVAGERDFVLNGRTRYDIECPICHMKRNIRAEKLDDALDKLRHAAISRIRLADLGAIGV